MCIPDIFVVDLIKPVAMGSPVQNTIQMHCPCSAVLPAAGESLEHAPICGSQDAVLVAPMFPTACVS